MGESRVISNEVKTLCGEILEMCIEMGGSITGEHGME